MRKSFHTLSGIITDAMGQDPCNGNVYIFINRDRIKLLHWEPGGMVQYSKLLEAGTLGKSDSASDNEVCANIEWRELVMIVEGIMDPAIRDARDLKTCKSFENSTFFYSVHFCMSLDFFITFLLRESNFFNIRIELDEMQRNIIHTG